MILYLNVVGSVICWSYLINYIIRKLYVFFLNIYAGLYVINVFKPDADESTKW